jgi:hypothetical protein
MNLFLNIDDTEPSNKFFVCDSCNTFTTFQNLNCACGKPPSRKPKNLDSESKGNSSSTSVDGQNGVFVSENVSIFMVFDDLKIVPSSLVTSLEMLNELGSSDLTQVEEVTTNISKQEVIVLYCIVFCLMCIYLTTHRPYNDIFFLAYRILSCLMCINLHVM